MKVIVVQKYDVQAVVMRRKALAVAGGARPSYLLLFSASQVFSAGESNAKSLGATLARALAQIGEHAVEFAADYGFASRPDAGSVKDAVRLLRTLNGKLWTMFNTAFQGGAAARFAAAWSGAASPAAGVPCFACVIDHPYGKAATKTYWPPRMNGEGAHNFGFFEPGTQVFIDALPRIVANELVDPHEFLVTGKV